MLTYGICLVNQAAVMVTSLGAYETSADVSSAGIKSRDEIINSAADTLCRASGIFDYLSTSLIPNWEATVGTDGIASRPVELTSDVTSALAKSAIPSRAEHQVLKRGVQTRSG